jgi:hypothetical protein
MKILNHCSRKWIAEHIEYKSRDKTFPEPIFVLISVYRNHLAEGWGPNTCSLIIKISFRRCALLWFYQCLFSISRHFKNCLYRLVTAFTAFSTFSHLFVKKIRRNSCTFFTFGSLRWYFWRSIAYSCLFHLSESALLSSSVYCRNSSRSQKTTQDTLIAGWISFATLRSLLLGSPTNCLRCPKQNRRRLTLDEEESILSETFSNIKALWLENKIDLTWIDQLQNTE